MMKAVLRNPQNGRCYFVVGLTPVDKIQLDRGAPVAVELKAFGFDVSRGEPHNLIVLHCANATDFEARVRKMELVDGGIIFHDGKDHTKTLS